MSDSDIKQDLACDRAAFLQRLRESRLLTEEQLAAVAARFGEGEPTHSLAAALIQEGILTLFQAKQVWAGRTKGLVLGQYRLLDELGRGGFGQVFKALHTLMARQVAIKVISPELVEDSRARTWFRREVLASTQLSHPNIVMAYDADEVDDVLFLVMEYVDGPNLDTFVRAYGPLPVGLACEVIRQGALALQHAHERGMVHRDIKPANLLLTGEWGAAGAEEGRARLVKVADFGLARLQRTAAAGTLMLQNERSFLGTPDYVSPEQARNMHAVDIRSDLYSLGCTFYNALTGRRPFQGTTVLEVIVQHLEAEPVALEELRPEAPVPVRAILRRLMAKNPDQRFQTPADLVAALAPHCAPAPLRPPTGPAPAAARDEQTPRPRSASSAVCIDTALVPKLAFWDGSVLSQPGPNEKAPQPAIPQAPPDEARSPATALVPKLAFWDGPVLAASERPAPPAVPPHKAETSGGERQAGGVPAGPGVAPPPEPAGHADRALTPPTPSNAEAAPPFRAGPALRTCWREWRTVVEAFAHGRRGPVNVQAFCALRTALLEQCRAGADDSRPALLERLESVVEPWLTPMTLAATDRPTLASLWEHCEALDRELLGPQRASVWPLLALVAVVTVALGLGWFVSQWPGWTTTVRPAIERAWELAASRPLLSLGAAVPVVLLAVIGILSRALKG